MEYNYMCIYIYIYNVAILRGRAAQEPLQVVRDLVDAAGGEHGLAVGHARLWLRDYK